MKFLLVLFLAVACANAFTKGGSFRKGGFIPAREKVVTPVKICVPEYALQDCEQMAQDLTSKGGNFVCVSARDKVDCLHKIRSGEADVTVLEPEEVYIAGEFMEDEFKIIKEIRNEKRPEEEFRYEGVAIIKSDSDMTRPEDLQGKKSCHTGYGRTVGWQIPIAKLSKMGILNIHCNKEMSVIEQEISSVSEFFGSSCVTGTWTFDLALDRHLKAKYPSLCSLCDNPEECSQKDNYASYDGTLRCLTQGGGDVAWSKVEVVKEFFKATTITKNQIDELKKYSYFCPDGTKVPLTTEKPCIWAARPWRSYIVKNSAQDSLIHDIQTQITKARELGQTDVELYKWYSSVLAFQLIKHDRDFDLTTPMTATEYNNKAEYTMTIEQNYICNKDKQIRFCVTSDEEMAKCQDFHFATFVRRVRPTISCVRAKSLVDCNEKIFNGLADIVVQSEETIYDLEQQESTDRQLLPLVSEQYGDDLYLYVLALIKSDSGIHSMEDLRGKKSCHPNIRSKIGFSYPAYKLQQNHLIMPTNCDYATALSKFFSESCIPGANDPKNMPHDSQVAQNLCSLCVGEDVNVNIEDLGTLSTGDGSKKCSASREEAFYGYFGAVRCLAQGGGDVAFVKQSILETVTSPLYKAQWAHDLKYEDYKILCQDGSVKPASEYKTCNWGKINGNKVVTSKTKPSVDVQNYRSAMMGCAYKFDGPTSPFALFTGYNAKLATGHKQSLLFTDVTTSLSSLEPLNQEYLNVLHDVVNCRSGAKLTKASFTGLSIETCARYLLQQAQIQENCNQQQNSIKI